MDHLRILSCMRDPNTSLSLLYTLTLLLLMYDEKNLKFMQNIFPFSLLLSITFAFLFSFSIFRYRH